MHAPRGLTTKHYKHQKLLSAIKKSLSKVDAMQNSIDCLDTQIAALIQWQTEVVHLAVHKINQTTESIQWMRPKVEDPPQWKPVAHKAIDTCHQSKRGPQNVPEGDTHMSRAAVSGKHARDDSPDSEEPNPTATAKRHHASRECTPTPPLRRVEPPTTPGATAFAEAAFTVCSSVPEGTTDFRRKLPPSEASNWSPHAVKLLLAQWGALEMTRVEGWVRQHCGSEMNASVRGLKK